MRRFLWIVLLTVFIAGCSSSVAPVESEGEEVISLEENYTVIWNVPHTRAEGRASFNLELHQHNIEANTFRFKLETVVQDVEIDGLMLETPITRTLSRTDAITPNSTHTTDWINYEADRTLCWDIRAMLDDEALTLNNCFWASDIENPPQALE